MDLNLNSTMAKSMNFNLVFVKSMNLNVLIKHSMNVIFSNQNLSTVEVAIYKVVKKTQNQIRTELNVAEDSNNLRC